MKTLIRFFTTITFLLTVHTAAHGNTPVAAGAEQPDTSITVDSLEVAPLFGTEFKFRSLGHMLASTGLVATMFAMGVILPDAEVAKVLVGIYGAAFGMLANLPTQEAISRFYRLRFLHKISDLCKDSGDCSVEWVEIPDLEGELSKVPRVIFKDGWFFQLNTNFSKVEVATAPASAVDAEVLEARIQRYVFDAAAKAGLRPPETPKLLDGSSISIHVQSAFGSDVLLFRNFLVDFANHRELAEGIWHNNTRTARPLLASEDSHAAFARIIDLIDSGHLQTIEAVALILETDMPKSFSRRFALSVASIINPSVPFEEKVLEVKSFRPQLNARENTLLTKLLDRRLQYLRSLNGPLQLTKQTEQIDPEAQLRSYQQYVLESGLDWSEYSSLLSEPYQSLPCDSFLIPAG